MPKIPTTPKNLKPYLFHGVSLDWSEGQAEAIGDCPWCGKEGKFSLNVNTDQWQCFVCKTGTDKGGGNSRTFLKRLWEESDKATKDYEELAKDRKLLYPETLAHWGVCKSILTGEWLIPGWDKDGKLMQLYKYVRDKDGKRRLMPTPNHNHHLHGVNLFDRSKPIVYVCEGPWDGIALWETLRFSKQGENGGLSLTGNDQVSILRNANVVAIPGCGSVGEPFLKWLSLLGGKIVVFLFDSDHPQNRNGRLIEPAGYTAVKRAVHLLATHAEEQPEEVHYLHWGKEGYDPDLPSGTDVRDLLGAASNPTNRVAALQRLLERVSPIPEGWVAGQKKGAKRGSTEMELLPCTEWKVVQNSWRKAMKWTEGLNRALAVSFATSLSTPMIGDQLWVKLVGPPSCGKSVICEALSVNKTYIYPKSTLRGFHSGFQSDKEGTEDNSLIVRLRGKTLVTKDGDTILQAPNKDQILSEARDLYDTTSRSSYRNKMSKDYEGVRMTWLLCGTESLRQIDSSELGERFLDCVIMEDIDDELEDEIGWRKINQVVLYKGVKADGKKESLQDPIMTQTMQLTGGYIQYLRENGERLLDEIEVSDEVKRECMRLGKFVSYMRARPSKKQDESQGREMSARLIAQHGRLAICLAVVLNKKEVDRAVMRMVTKVALDTARGRTLDIIKYLYPKGEVGSQLSSIALGTHHLPEEESKFVRFLRKLGAVTDYKQEVAPGVKGPQRWRLTPKLAKLYRAVVENYAAHTK